MILATIAAMSFVPCIIANTKSAHIQITGNTDIAESGQMIQDLLDKNCPTSEKVIKTNCDQLDKPNVLSTVCYVDSTAGSFFVTKDFIGSTHIVYSSHM